jgi:hypothetical protein
LAARSTGDQQPLNWLSERFTLHGVPIPFSTLADTVGSISFALSPIAARVETQNRLRR